MKHIDVSALPDALRLAEEVQRTGQPKVLVRDGRPLAVLSPAAASARPPKRARKPRRVASPNDGLLNLAGVADGEESPAAANPNDWLLNLVAIADECKLSDGPTDVSSNKHKYLADALYEKSHRTEPG